MRTYGLGSFMYDSEEEKCQENAGRFILGSGTVERLLALPSVRDFCDYFRPWWAIAAVHDCHSCIFLFPLGLPVRAQGCTKQGLPLLYSTTCTGVLPSLAGTNGL